MRLKHLPALFFIILLSVLCYGTLVSATPSASVVGKVDYLRGVVSAKTASATGRLLAKDAPLYETDSIVTGRTSFAILVFQDGTKVTVRPKSVFVISEYRFDKNSKNNTVFRLFKGGIRTVTGAINKQKAETIKLITPTMRVAIAETNTDLVLHSCDGDCDNGKFVNQSNSHVVAHIALAKKTVYVKNEAGKRMVQTGYRLKEKDTVLTNNEGFAVLVFSDKTRITVESNSEFMIDTFLYPQGRPKQGKVLLRLIKGGARTLTGLIGQANPDQFKLKTPVATMGIRGTGFDTYYDQQVYVTVWQGGVTAIRTNDQGRKRQNIALNQTFRIDNTGFNQLTRFPQAIQVRFRPELRPDRVNTQRTWLSVKHGQVTLTNTRQKMRQQPHQVMTISAGEAVVINQTKPPKITTLPPLISNDPYTALPPTQLKATPPPPPVNSNDGAANQEKNPPKNNNPKQNKVQQKANEPAENNRPRERRNTEETGQLRDSRGSGSVGIPPEIRPPRDIKHPREMQP